MNKGMTVTTKAVRLPAVRDNASKRLGHNMNRFSEHLLIPLIIAAATLAVHGWSLFDGLHFDDHLHTAQYRERGWSLDALINSTTINSEMLMGHWWQEKPCQWQYFRPLSVALAKGVYLLTGESTIALHGLSVTMHMLTAYLVYVFCFKITTRRGWSLMGGLFFTFYAHTLVPVAWPAAQNVILQTLLLLAAMLCYVRASGLNLDALRPTQDTKAPGLQPGWLAAMFGLWALGLLSREGAVVLPVFCLSLDYAFGGKAWAVRRWRLYLLMFCLAGAFTIWRLLFFHFPMPDFYVRHVRGIADIPWWLMKLLYYITSVVWSSPMTVGISARYDVLRETPGELVLMAVIVLVMGTGYFLATRQTRGWWVWPMWILFSVLPVVSVLPTPHSGYMPGVGFAIALAVAVGVHDRVHAVGLGRLARPVAVGLFIANIIWVPLYRVLWVAFPAAERFTIQSAAAYPPDDQLTDVFLINWPFVNVYTTEHLRKAWGLADHDLRFHALTYTTDALGANATTGVVVRQDDSHRFTVTATEKPFFSGALGRFLVEGMRSSGRFEIGQRIEGGLFDVEIVDADEQGVRSLRFEFVDQLSNPAHRFYVYTPDHGAHVRRFDPERDESEGAPDRRVDVDLSEISVRDAGSRLAAGDLAAADVLLTGLNSVDADIRARAEKSLIDAVLPVCNATADPCEIWLANSENADRAGGRAAWWKRHMNAVTYELARSQPDSLAKLAAARERLNGLRGFFRWIFVRSDLYLTGEPFPDPR